MSEDKMETSDEKEKWRNKLGLSSDIDINVVHRYSHLGEKLLRTTQNTLVVKSTGTLQVCDVCARLKAKELAVRKKTYTRASQSGERIFCGIDWSVTGDYN